MTLEQLRALRPVRHESELVQIEIEIPVTATNARIQKALMGRFRSAPAALQWLDAHPDAARVALVARLYCPKRKRLAELYCLPEDCPPVRDSGGYRLLIVPTSRGRLSALGGMATNTRKPGAAWWYIDDRDVWDLRCKCCPHPDGGIRAADFLSDDPPTGYSTVLL
jgi:hypothetical protein